MRAGKGKSKGSSFERLICTRLSLWVTNGQRNDIFWRSATSGGRATMRSRKGEKVTVQFGDICAVDPLGHPFLERWYLECKAYRDLRLASFILSGTGPLRNFWDRAKQEAKSYRREPMLICKQNQFPVFVILPRRHDILDSVRLTAVLPSHNCTVVLFDDIVNTQHLASKKQTVRRTK